MKPGDRVRGAFEGARNRNWRGTVVSPHPAAIPSPQLLVRWDEMPGAAPDLYSPNHLELIPPDPRVVALVLGQSLSDAALAWALDQCPWDIREILWIDGLPKKQRAIAWAKNRGIPVCTVSLADIATALSAPPSGIPRALLAVSDGGKHPVARQAISAAKQSGVEIHLLTVEFERSMTLHNLKTCGDIQRPVYIGRGTEGWLRSPLANPHSIKAMGRSAACERFRAENLYPALSQQAGPIWLELNRLSDRVLAGDRLDILCHCAPAECHGADIIAAVAHLAKQRLNL